MRHLQGRSGKIVAIKVSNYVKQEDIRQKTQGNPPAGAAANVIGDNDWGRQCVSAKMALVGHVAPSKSHAIIYQLRRAAKDDLRTPISPSHFRQRCEACRNQAITPTTTLEIPRRLFHWVVGVMAFNANYDY